MGATPNTPRFGSDIPAAALAGASGVAAAWAAANALEASERHLALWLHRRTAPPLTNAMQAISDLGATRTTSAAVLLACAILATRRRWRGVAFLTAATVLAHAGNAGLKLALQRPRPALPHPSITPDGYAFPSAHVMTALATYGALATIATIHLRARSARALCIALSAALLVMIGASRIYLAAHYPTDVLAGYTGGLAAVALAAGVTRATPTGPSTRRP